MQVIKESNHRGLCLHRTHINLKTVPYNALKNQNHLCHFHKTLIKIG